MIFKCFFSQYDKLIVTNEYSGIRFEMESEEPIVYLKREDLSKLIKHLQSLEENK